MAGLINPIAFDEEIRKFIPPTVSVGLEKGLKSSKYSIGGQINYGYTFVSYQYGNTWDENMMDYGAFKGLSIFCDFRRYFKLPKRPNSIQKELEGLFIGIYGGVQSLNENSFKNYSKVDYSITDYYLASSNAFWGAGLGGMFGYKKNVYKKVYSEAMAGFGYALYSKDFTHDNHSGYQNIFRLELSIGYKF